MNICAIHTVNGADLTAAQLYTIWQIRDSVFAVEQRVDAVDADGFDLLAHTTHFWMADTTGLRCYLRVLLLDGVRNISRVCSRADQRGQGLANALLSAAHQRWRNDVFGLSAQAHLRSWYENHGYRRNGANYTEAGIDHVPMTRRFKEN